MKRPRKSSMPPWLKRNLPKESRSMAVFRLLEHLHLHTVCQGAKCPNMPECFGRGTATFMILGGVCTRNCRFCAVPEGIPLPPDEDEPRHVAEAVASLNLRYAVVTSVTRDDLADGGSGHFAKTIQEIRARCGASVEVLTPDFKGNEADIARVADAMPDVFNHNIETVPRLYSAVRPQADYRRSLEFLRFVKKHKPEIITKSGLMVGVGETNAEVIESLKDLREVGCDFVTIGQYLRPSKAHLEIARFVPPAEFDALAETARSLGFGGVASAPFVRSSYHAGEMFAAPAGDGSDPIYGAQARGLAPCPPEGGPTSS